MATSTGISLCAFLLAPCKNQRASATDGRFSREGYLDLISKGEKFTADLHSKILARDALLWFGQCSLVKGFVFVGTNGNPMSARGISLGLKRCAKRYGVNPDVVYPHSFRHRFAKNFIAKNPDIAFLADLMDTKASRLHVYTCGVPPRSSAPQSMRLSIGNENLELGYTFKNPCLLFFRREPNQDGVHFRLIHLRLSSASYIGCQRNRVDKEGDIFKKNFA